jgi:hypothetical protein
MGFSPAFKTSYYAIIIVKSGEVTPRLPCIYRTYSVTAASCYVITSGIPM